MYKNIASQKIAVFAWDGANGVPKTGDAANITAQISKDGGACAASNDVNPTELDAANAKGIYIFDLTQAESNCDLLVLSAVSSTGDIDIRPVIIYTQNLDSFKATGFNTVVPDAAGTAPTASEIQTEIEENGASVIDTIRDYIENVTYGLSALKTLIDSVPTAIENRQEMDSNSTRLDANVSTRSSHDAAAVKTAMEAAGGNLDELHKLQGLDIAEPMTVTSTSRKVGTIEQTISGDGTTTSTVTRTA